ALPIFAVGQREDAVAARAFDRVQLIDEVIESGFGVPGSGFAVLGSRFLVLGSGFGVRTLNPRTPNPEPRTANPKVFLPPYLCRLLVVAQSEVDRVPQPAVGGPFGEFDLRDQLGSHPMCALVRFRPPAKRTFFRFARLQELHHAGELFFVEARSRVTDVDQISVLVVHAEQQRPEVRPRLPRLGPPADDELLLVDDFQLTPVRRPLARLVLRIGALGDEAFPAVVERLFVERAAVAALHRAETQQRRAGPSEQPFERRAMERGDGRALYKEALDHGWEGLIAK